MSQLSNSVQRAPKASQQWMVPPEATKPLQLRVREGRNRMIQQ